MAKETTKKEDRAEVTAEKAAVKVEKEAKKAEVKADVVHVMFGIDPSLDANHQFLTYCINGTIYSYPRGVTVEVPKTVFEAIEIEERDKRTFMQLYSEYEGTGKKLDM